MFAVIKDLDLIVELDKLTEIYKILRRKMGVELDTLDVYLKIREAIEKKRKVFDGHAIEYYTNMEEVLLTFS